jgi:hypothetical protein
VSKVTVFRPDTTKLVDNQTVTVTSSVATYPIAALTLPSTENLGEGWMVQWDLYLGAALTYRQFRVDAALIRTKLWPSASNIDLLDRHPELASQYPYGESSWDKVINSAWQSIELRLLESGRRPYLIMNPWGLRESLVLLSLARVFRSLSTFTPGTGKYVELATEYMKEYEKEWDRVKLTIDWSNEGYPDPADQGQAASPVVFLSNSPVWPWGGNY